MAQKKDEINGSFQMSSSNIETTLRPLGKQQYLQKEYQTLTEHLDMMRKQIINFTKENKFLDKEAKWIRQENRIFASYMEKQTQKKEDSIIRLSDYYQYILEETQKEKEKILVQFKEEEIELRSQLLERQTRFSALSKEVEELQLFKDLQAEQSSRLKELELEVLSMWIMHADNVHDVETKFLRDKIAYEIETQRNINRLAKEMVKEASHKLTKHILKLKEETPYLICELVKLIHRVGPLTMYKYHLKEQNRKLREELEYNWELIHTLHVHWYPPDQGGKDRNQGRRLDLPHLWQLLRRERAMEQRKVLPQKISETLTNLMKSLMSETPSEGVPQLMSALARNKKIVLQTWSHKESRKKSKDENSNLTEL